MSDTCTLSQLSPMSLTTVSVSPGWVIPVLYHSYHLTVIDYRYHSSWWYCYSIVRDIGDKCDRVHVSLILVILIQYSKRHRMSLTVLYQYHQDEWYLYSITVITYVSFTVLYQYHQDKWYLYSITFITYVSDYYTVVRDIGDKCDRVQVSLILVILTQYSQRHRW
jgi:hypothetical protein